MLLSWMDTTCFRSCVHSYSELRSSKNNRINRGRVNLQANYRVGSNSLVFFFDYPFQIDLRKEELLQVLSLCMEFGLPMLRVHCIEHLSETLNTEKVCSILIGAQSALMESESKGDGMESTFQEIVQKCLGFIEANTKAVFQSPGFLQLSKEQLTAIISSNKVPCLLCFVNASIQGAVRILAHFR